MIYVLDAAAVVDLLVRSERGELLAAAWGMRDDVAARDALYVLPSPVAAPSISR